MEYVKTLSVKGSAWGKEDGKVGGGFIGVVNGPRERSRMHWVIVG